MPLYVQNGNLLNKTGTLGTSVGCCCDPPVPPPPEELCCCLTSSVTKVDSAEECDGTTSPVASPVVDLEDITIVVDWDGLTVVLVYYPDGGGYWGNVEGGSSAASEAVEFSCLTPGVAEAFNATERNFIANFYTQTSGNCRWFTSNITAFFVGKTPSNNFDAAAQSVVLGPYVGECKLLAPVDENDTSCTFTQNGFWCMGNPFSDTVTVEMIIAP